MPSYALRLALAFVVLSACSKVDPLYCDPSTPCTDPERPFCDDNGEYPASDGIKHTCIPDPFGPDAAPQGECEPETSTCANDIEARCDSNGHQLPDRSCSLGCDGTGTRCLEIEPSNDLGQFLIDAASGPDLELPDGTIIDTDAGTVVIDGNTVSVPNAGIDAPADGVPLRVFIVASLAVTGDVVVRGERAIAVVADGDIVIEGILHVDARDTTPGPGAGPDGHGLPTNGVFGSVAGASGGGFGSKGGDGGSAGSATGFAGGAIAGNAELTPLRGGGNGGPNNDNLGGGGGGAVQLVSRASITVRAGGAIDAGGSGGGSSGFSKGAGAGGGILLEAPVVLVTGTNSALAANGGGGGCAGGVTREPDDGRLDDQRAAGCESSNVGDGGDGGAGDLPAQKGDNGPTDGTGGGGGGGVGRIRANTVAGTFEPLDGAIVSPPPSVGMLSVQ